MASVSRSMETGGSLWTSVPAIASSADLRDVASAFVLLQQNRHTADYDSGAVFSRTEVVEIIEIAESAFDAWQRVRGSAASNYYLLALLLGPPRRP